MRPDIFRRFERRGGARLKLEQSLGALPTGYGDVSPLYMLFAVSNAGRNEALLEKTYVLAGGDTTLDLTGELEGDGEGLSREIRPGERATLWLRAKGLAGRLRDAGYSGTPKLKLLVADSGGGEHTATFRLRVDEYLRLKDE